LASALFNIEVVEKMSLYYSRLVIQIHFTLELSTWELRPFILGIQCLYDALVDLMWKDYNKLSVIFDEFLVKNVSLMKISY
jgi:hypothetical protein